MKTALVARGVDAARLTSEDLGDTPPVGSNDTDEGRQQNRRVAWVKLQEARVIANGVP